MPTWWMTARQQPVEIRRVRPHGLFQQGVAGLVEVDEGVERCDAVSHLGERGGARGQFVTTYSLSLRGTAGGSRRSSGVPTGVLHAGRGLGGGCDCGDGGRLRGANVPPLPVPLPAGERGGVKGQFVTTYPLSL